VAPSSVAEAVAEFAHKLAKMASPLPLATRLTEGVLAGNSVEEAMESGEVVEMESSVEEAVAASTAVVAIATVAVEANGKSPVSCKSKTSLPTRSWWN